MFFVLGIQGNFFDLGIPSAANQLALLIYICAPLSLLTDSSPFVQLSDITPITNLVDISTSAKLTDASPSAGIADISPVSQLKEC